MNCYVQFMSYEFIINVFFKDQTWVNKSKKKIEMTIFIHLVH